MSNRLVLMLGEEESDGLFDPILVEMNPKTLEFCKNYINSEINLVFSDLPQDQKALATNILSSVNSCDTLISFLSLKSIYVEEVVVLNSI